VPRPVSGGPYLSKSGMYLPDVPPEPSNFIGWKHLSKPDALFLKHWAGLGFSPIFEQARLRSFKKSFAE